MCRPSCHGQPESQAQRPSTATGLPPRSVPPARNPTCAAPLARPVKRTADPPICSYATGEWTVGAGSPPPMGARSRGAAGWAGIAPAPAAGAPATAVNGTAVPLVLRPSASQATAFTRCLPLLHGLSRCQDQVPSAATAALPRNLPCSHRLTRTAPGAVPVKYTPFVGSSLSGAGWETTGMAMVLGRSAEVADR